MKPPIGLFLLVFLLHFKHIVSQNAEESIPVNVKKMISGLSFSDHMAILKSIKDMPHIGQKFSLLSENLEKVKNLSATCRDHVSFYVKNLNAVIERGANGTPFWANQMYDSFGGLPSGILQLNGFWLGDMHQCISVDVWKDEAVTGTGQPDFSGKYCLTSLSFVPAFGLIPPARIGICLPSTCSQKEIQKLAHHYVTLPLNLITQSEFCQTTRETRAWDGTSIAIGVLFLVLIGLVVVGTIFDQSILLSKCKAVGKNGVARSLLLAFSAKMNLTKIFKIDPPKGGETNYLGALNGMRTMTMAWIVVGHTYLIINADFGFKNQFHGVKYMWRKVFQPIIMGEFAVDTFLTISGFLLTYMLMSNWKKSNGKFNVFKFLIHRVFRLTPAYALLLAYMCGPYADLNMKGPLVPASIFDRNVCRERWWHNILFINVYLDDHLKCLPQAWYLCVDVAFYAVTPIILYPLFKKPNVGYLVFMVFFIASFAIPGGLIYHYNLASYPATNIQPGARKDFMWKVYNKPWGRMSAYLIGMFYGYFLFLKGSKVKINKFLVTVAWILTPVIALFITTWTYRYVKIDAEVSTVMRVLYGTMSRPMWAMAVGWIILACATGHGGYMNSILSWEGFVPFARISYCAYVVHFTVIGHVYAGRQDCTYIDWYIMICYCSSILMLTGGAALLFSLLSEGPFLELEKILLRRQPNKMNGKSKSPSKLLQSDGSKLVYKALPENPSEFKAASETPLNKL